MKWYWISSDVLVELLGELVEALQRSEVLSEQLVVLFLFLDQLRICLLDLAGRYPWHVGQYGLRYHAFLPILPTPVVLLQILLVSLLHILSLFILPPQILVYLLQLALRLLQQRLARDLNLSMQVFSQFDRVSRSQLMLNFEGR